VKRLFFAICVSGVLLSSGVSAQTQPFRWTADLYTGVLAQGSLASADFIADFSNFGGVVVQRSGGSLDVVTSAIFGIRGGYRLSDRFHVTARWGHSEGRYRISFPAQASDPGDFNLEGLILGAFDFQYAGSDTRPESALSLAVTDVYLAAIRYEVPTLNRWLFPFVTVGGGIFTQRSQGDVIEATFQGPVPAQWQIAEIAGGNPLTASGLSAFKINSKDLLVSIGAGFRASIGRKWGVSLEIEDLVRLSPDLDSLNGLGELDPPDPSVGEFWATAFQPTDGSIHNLSVQVAATYALWPYGTRR
jgi:hypothetical protein